MPSTRYGARNVGAAKMTASQRYSVSPGADAKRGAVAPRSRAPAVPVRTNRPTRSQQLLHDPAVALRPGQRALLVVLARREIVKPGPGGHVGRQRAVVVAAGVVHVPEQRLRVEPVLARARRRTRGGRALRPRLDKAASSGMVKRPVARSAVGHLRQPAELFAIAGASIRPPARCLPAIGRRGTAAPAGRSTGSARPSVPSGFSTPELFEQLAH